MTVASLLRRRGTGVAAYNPLTAIGWDTAVWAEDPTWSHPADGAAVASWPTKGLNLLDTYLDNTLGMRVADGKNAYGAKIDHDSSFNITGDLEFVAKMKLDSWTPATHPRGIVEKRVSNDATTTLAWEYAIRSDDGTFQTIWIESGGTLKQALSTAAISASPGDTKWVKTTLDVDNGSSGWTCRFYQSDDGSSWTQIGADVTGAGVTNIRTNTSPFSLGMAAVSGGSFGIGGYMQRAILRNGIGGTAVFDVDFTGHGGSRTFTESVASLPVQVSDPTLVQASATRRPLYRAAVAALNNKPAVQGDGVNDYLESVTALGGPAAQPYSIVLIASGNAPTTVPITVMVNNIGWAFYWDAGANAWWATSEINGGQHMEASAGSADSGPHLLRFYANHPSSVIAKDETVVSSSGDSGPGGVPRTFGLFDINTLNFPSPANIAFAGVYAGNVTAAAGWAVFKVWVTSHYGITVA